MSTLVALALLAVCFWLVANDLFLAIRDGTVPCAARWGWVWLPIVFLLVFAAKLLLMREFPMTAPHWDQWDGKHAAFTCRTATAACLGRRCSRYTTSTGSSSAGCLRSTCCW